MSYKPSIQSQILPFWRRMPLFFIFPANSNILLRLLLLAILGAIPLTMMKSPIFLPAMALFNFIAWVMFFRYAYHVMEMTAKGYLKPAEYPLNYKSESNSKPYKQMSVFILIAILIGVVFGVFGKFLGFMALIFAILALPTSVMVIAMEDSVSGALNPLKSLRIMATIGWPYLVMFGFLTVLYSSQGIASGWIIKTQLPTLQHSINPQQISNYQDVLGKKLELIVLSSNFISMYFTLIMFNMIGYVLYQYHDELGLSVSVNAHGNNRDSELAQYVARGDIGNALELAQDELGRDYSNIAANDRYFKLLLMANFPERTARHAQRFISLLIQQNQPGKAADIYEKMLNVNADFQAAHSDEVLPVAQAARLARKPELALRIMKKFDKRYPDSPKIPDVYFYGAQLISEEFNNFKEARTILNATLERYPEYRAKAEVLNYLQLLEQLEKT